MYFKDQMTILLLSQREHITESSINNHTGNVLYPGRVVILQPCIENDGWKDKHHKFTCVNQIRCLDIYRVYKKNAKDHMSDVPRLHALINET